MDSTALDKRIKELMALPTEELIKIRDENMAKEKALMDHCNNLVKRQFMLTEKKQLLDDELSTIKVNRLKMESLIKIAKENELEIVEKFKEFEEKTTDNHKEFGDLTKTTKKIYASYKTRRAEVSEFKKEMQKEIDQAKLKNSEALNELNLKKESLEATKQVLESKMACVQHDRSERVKKEKILEGLKKCNYEKKLRELHIQEELMKKEFSELSSKRDAMKQVLVALDNQTKTLNNEADSLALQLSEIVKNNEELRKSTEFEEEFLKKSFTEKASKEAQKIHDENMKLASGLRNDLIQSDQLAGEIQKLSIDFKNNDKTCKDLAARISDKKALTKKVEDEIEENKQTKEKLLKEALKISEMFEKKKKSVDEYKQKVDKMKGVARSQGKKGKAGKRGKLAKKADMEISTDSSSGDTSLNLTMSSISGVLPDINDVLAKILSETSASSKEDN